MMKGIGVLRFVCLAVALCTGLPAIHAQDSPAKLYDPQVNAAEQLAQAVSEAASGKKHVLIQVGGNWCSWCHKLEKLFTSDARIDSILNASYVMLRVNHSKENRNLPVLARLGHPQRFGFPVLVVLDGSGNRLHTQDSSFLEEGKQYNPERVVTFLRAWTAQAVDPASYTDR